MIQIKITIWCVQLVWVFAILAGMFCLLRIIVGPGPQ
jgi:hypothetical protein